MGRSDTLVDLSSGGKNLSPSDRHYPTTDVVTAFDVGVAVGRWRGHRRVRGDTGLE